MVEILKQNQYVPMPVEKQIAIIFAAANGLLDDIDQSKVNDFEDSLLSHLDASHKDILDSIKNTGAIDDNINDKLLKAIENFKSGYSN